MSLSTIFEGSSLGIAGLPAFTIEVAAVDIRHEAVLETAAITPSRIEAKAGHWVECDEPTGMVAIHDPRLFRPGREAFSRALADAAIKTFGASCVEVCLISSTCRLEFPPGAFDRTELSRRVAEAVKAAASATRDQGSGRLVTKTSTGSPRIVNLALAGGSLTMAVAGFILPGVPSIPFFLLATRHAARFSPTIEHMLACVPWCASLLTKVDAQGEPVRFDGRSLLKWIPITLVAMGVFMVVHPPLPVVMGLEFGVMAIVALREWLAREAEVVALALPV